MKIDGKAIAEKIFEELKEKVKKLQNKIPHLAIILVGNDPASVAYVNQKKIKGEKIGAKITILNSPSTISNSELLTTIEQFNNDSNVHGIIVQQPLPPQIDVERITQTISPKKDVDGFRSNSPFEMPIFMAVEFIFEYIGCSLKNKKIVIIGKGESGGGPIIKGLQKLGISPTIIDSKTKNPTEITKNADIIICAVGKTNVIKSDMIKKGVILISVGLHKKSDGKLTGDYDEDEIKNIASFYTPTPGGIGPINVAMLLKNLIQATEKKLKRT